MNFTQIVNFVCNKVSKTDSNSLARCAEYVAARHKMIYESFDWKAAQTLVPKTIAAGAGTTTTLTVPEVHHVLSVKLDGKLLDPVTPSLIFEREVTETDEYATAGTPRYYEEFLDMTSQTRSLRFFPPLADDGVNNHSLVILGKTPYNESATQCMIPGTENALIAYATGDMWEYLHEVGKAQVKLTEGGQLIDAAKQLDTPGSQRPRRSRRLTAKGNSLIEMSDAVCTIIGDFQPDTRNTVREMIRLCYLQVWQSGAWPKAYITDMPTVLSDNTAICTHLMDEVVAVRANLSTDPNSQSYVPLQYEDSQVIMGLTPEAFSQDGTPISYNVLMPVALPVEISGNIQIRTVGSLDKQTVFIAGEETQGGEVSETLNITSTPATSSESYRVIYTISKQVSASGIQILDMSSNVLDNYKKAEQTRKYPRIQILPGYDSSIPDQTLFVLGKRHVPQLLDDGDVPEITGVENVLINQAASDMFAKMGKTDMVQIYNSKASGAMQTLIDRETKQQTYQPRILPYTEPQTWRLPMGLF